MNKRSKQKLANNIINKVRALSMLCLLASGLVIGDLRAHVGDHKQYYFMDQSLDQDTPLELEGNSVPGDLLEPMEDTDQYYFMDQSLDQDTLLERTGAHKSILERYEIINACREMAKNEATHHTPIKLAKCVIDSLNRLTHYKNPKKKLQSAADCYLERFNPLLDSKDYRLLQTNPYEPYDNDTEHNSYIAFLLNNLQPEINTVLLNCADQVHVDYDWDGMRDHVLNELKMVNPCVSIYIESLYHTVKQCKSRLSLFVKFAIGYLALRMFISFNRFLTMVEQLFG